MRSPRFPVVCLGASAGGLEPITRIVGAIPADTGLAIVIVNHLRHHHTHLPELLGNVTTMSVELITEGMRLRPRHVFVIPRNCELTICEEVFHLKELSKRSGWPTVITLFLTSLARNWDGRVVAVILSGVGSDGAEALEAVKTSGGATYVQKPESAEYGGMPQSAIETGFADFILLPEEIARELASMGIEDFQEG